MKALRALAFIALLPGLAAAQTFPSVPDGTVIGRIGSGASSGPSQAIPFATLASRLQGTVAANTVNAGPTSGASSLPTFRLLVGADLPAPSASTLGGIESITCATHTWLSSISIAGVPACTQPGVADISGFGTGVATALAVNVGSAGAFVTFNGALGTPSSATLTSATGLPLSTGLTGAGTGVLTALGVNIGTAGSPVVNGGALGTPSSGVATNLTGTAASLTAGNVTTNANLTGPVTSVGNATTIGANQVTRAMEAQGVARSVVGVTGNATANVADIQGTANQVLTVNSAGTALAFGTVNLAAAAAVTGTLPAANGGTGDTGTAWAAFTPTVTCGTATFTTTSARFKTQGKITFAELDVTFTALGTCTNLLTFSLPATAQSAGSLMGREVNVTGKGAACGFAASATTTGCTKADGTNWANTERVQMSGVYENQ